MRTIIFILFLFFFSFSAKSNSGITFCGKETNDLYRLLVNNQLNVRRFENLDQALRAASKGTGLIITAENYPKERVSMSQKQYNLISRKKLRVYVEYPNYIPGKKLPDSCYVGLFERAVVSSDVFGKDLPNLSVLTVNDCHIISIEEKDPLLVYAKVAGFDKAEYGLTETKLSPLLYKYDDGIMIALSSLSNYKLGRFGPCQSWKFFWEYVCSWLLDEELAFSLWQADPQPMYSAKEKLPTNARRLSVEKGTEWLYKGKFFIHPSWKAKAFFFQANTKSPIGPPIPYDFISGDGSLGVLEGHRSYVCYDGRQQYRYFRRCDVQGEVAYLLASAHEMLNTEKYKISSEKLLDFMFYDSEYRQGSHNKKESSAYGLLGWGDNVNSIFYSDDNARAVLGAIGASALLKNERWNLFIVENILANFRTASKQGFHGDKLTEKEIIKNAWPFYSNRDYTNLSPHFESYCWALYLWLYDKTAYKPLLDKAKTAIRIMMEAYPNWKLVYGIQSERGRMLLPLSWLVRVEDVPEHRAWLDLIAKDLLLAQVPSGAIKEDLGEGTGGRYGRTKSNATYGTAESTLNFRNTDKVADMLYTCNFALLGLNEAASATGAIQYREAAEKLADFLMRAQVKSENHPDIDGAWFRAFDYGRWDYWAENADVGWGAWCTLSGWIQSWIVGTHVSMEKNKSFWETTKYLDMKDALEKSLWMLDSEKSKKGF